MSQGKPNKTVKIAGSNLKTLSETEKKVLNYIEKGLHISQNPRAASLDKLSFGQRMADKLSGFGGSWTFIFSFLAIVSMWILLNSRVLGGGSSPFDPFPFILLNLLLSLMATLQAPVILMAQKRQEDKDRDAALHDYEINLKAELEIMSLHEKLDALVQEKLKELLATQIEQGKQLDAIVESLKSSGA